jgi:hypothetical protein
MSSKHYYIAAGIPAFETTHIFLFFSSENLASAQLHFTWVLILVKPTAWCIYPTQRDHKKYLGRPTTPSVGLLSKATSIVADIFEPGQWKQKSGLIHETWE